MVIVSGILKLTVALLALAAARRVAATPVSAALNARPEPSDAGWELMPSPFGPGAWLTAPSDADVVHAFVPPGTKAAHDESDHARRGWRHLTVDADLSVQPTWTRLDAHEVFTMVPPACQGWVMEQSLRFADGTVRGADLLETLVGMGVKPDQLDRALRALGRQQRLDAYVAAALATKKAIAVRHRVIEASQAACAATAETVASAVEEGLSFISRDADPTATAYRGTPAEPAFGWDDITEVLLGSRCVR